MLNHDNFSIFIGNIVKSILHDFEDVKRVIESGNKILEPMVFLTKVRNEIATANLESEFPDQVYKINTTLQQTRRSLTKDQQNIVENQVQFLKFMMKLKAILKGVSEPVQSRFAFFSSNTASEPEIELLKYELQSLVKWVMEKRIRFSEQELEDFNEELLYSWILFSYKALKIAKERKNILLSNTLSTTCMEYIKTKLESGKKLSEYQFNKKRGKNRF